MNVCRLCGMVGTWEWGLPGEQISRLLNRGFRLNAPGDHSDHVLHIGEMCRHCNWLYNKFYRRQHDYCIERNELALVEFIAHRLHLLAKRHAAGRPITRCQALIPPVDRCSHFWTEEVAGHKLCVSHTKAFKRGHLSTFAPENSTWGEQVVEFFTMNSDAEVQKMPSSCPPAGLPSPGHVE